MHLTSVNHAHDGHVQRYPVCDREHRAEEGHEHENVPRLGEAPGRFGTTILDFGLGSHYYFRWRVCKSYHVQRWAKKYANLAKQDPGRARHNR